MRVGIVARFSDSWSAGQYYIENVLRALIELNDPAVEITVLTDEKNIRWSEKIPQPKKLRTRRIEPRYNIFERITNKLSRQFKGEVWRDKRIKEDEFDVIFPLGRMGEWAFELTDRCIYWIPDFQEIHFPENFSEEECKKREDERRKIAMEAKHLVLSSHAAEADLQRFFPEYSVKVHVLPFAVYNEVPPAKTHSAVLKKYGVDDKPYFICPNQFWKHKNHMILIDAWTILRGRLEGEFPTLLFSGREEGFVGEGAAVIHKQRVAEVGLENDIQFLGFIDRSDLMVLIKHAQALLQPSLFEGWNTSIEDAKSIGTPVLASDIFVHGEQLQTEDLITPRDSGAWADAVEDAVKHPLKGASDYEDDLHTFQQRLLQTFEECAEQ